MMYLTFKRIADVFVSIIALLVLSPILVPISIILKLSAEGEIFYKQKRVGYKNNIFEIFKFATMLKDSPNLGTGDITLRNDPRVTWIGKYLRMTKINELPQILNILNGDMSFVGPRPLMIAGYEGYSDELKQKVYNAKPGLTGIGSIVFRDEEKIMTDSDLPPRECYENVILPHKGSLEVWYQENLSFKTDFLILFLTAWVIIFPSSDLHHKVFSNLPERLATHG